MKRKTERISQKNWKNERINMKKLHWNNQWNKNMINQEIFRHHNHDYLYINIIKRNYNQWSKSKYLSKVFFSLLFITNINDINDSMTYRFWVSCNFNITKQQIQMAIKKLISNKTSNSNEIFNKVFKEYYDKI